MQMLVEKIKKKLPRFFSGKDFTITHFTRIKIIATKNIFPLLNRGFKKLDFDQLIRVSEPKIMRYFSVF